MSFFLLRCQSFCLYNSSLYILDMSNTIFHSLICLFTLSFSYLLMNRSPSLLLKVTNTYGDYQLLDTVQCILHRITLLILIMTLLAIREIPLALFLRWGNWVKETLSNLLKVTHLVSGGVRQIRISKMILKRRTKRGGFSLIKQRYLSSSG